MLSLIQLITNYEDIFPASNTELNLFDKQDLSLCLLSVWNILFYAYMISQIQIYILHLYYTTSTISQGSITIPCLYPWSNLGGTTLNPIQRAFPHHHLGVGQVKLPTTPSNF